MQRSFFDNLNLETNQSERFGRLGLIKIAPRASQWEWCPSFLRFNYFHKILGGGRPLLNRSRSRRRALLTSALSISILLIMFFSAGATAAEKVYWGGVGFISWEDRDQLFPQSSKLLCRTARSCPNGNIDLMARPHFEGKSYGNFELSMDLIGTKAVEGVIMAPMIFREVVGINKVISFGKTKFIHNYQIFASVIFFEFGTGRFVGALPVLLQHTETMSHKATDAEKFSVFSDLLGNEKKGRNVFKELYEVSKNANPFTFSEKFGQITEVNLGETVQTIIVQDKDLSSWKTQVGQIFETYLVKETGAPLIPSMGKDQLSGELIATFQSASKKITLPEPAFLFALDIRKFKLFRSEKGKQVTECYVVLTTLRVNGLLDELMNVRFGRTKNSCGVAHSSSVFEGSFQFTKSLFSLLQRIARQFGGEPDEKFLKEASPKDPHAAEHIKRVKSEVFSTGL